MLPFPAVSALDVGVFRTNSGSSFVPIRRQSWRRSPGRVVVRFFVSSRVCAFGLESWSASVGVWCCCGRRLRKDGCRMQSVTCATNALGAGLGIVTGELVLGCLGGAVSKTRTLWELGSCGTDEWYFGSGSDDEELVIDIVVWRRQLCGDEAIEREGCRCGRKERVDQEFEVGRHQHYYTDQEGFEGRVIGMQKSVGRPVVHRSC